MRSCISLHPARAELLWCRWMGLVSVSSSPLVAFPCPLPSPVQLQPCLLPSLCSHLAAWSWEALLSLVPAGFVGFFFLLLSTEWKWFAVILEWGFFHMKGKKESIYLDTHLDARRIPSRSKECCLESIIDLLWSKWSENFAKPRNVYSVLTRQGFFLWKISFALENELFHRFVSAVINMI